ncbi:MULTISPECIES: hypothetical protein [Chryseobacterium]|nr:MULTISPECIES: hypothetical protein [Chryseobacterium]MDR6919391.1 hypothetical protein [Chryseobacterium sp. 2987]
MKKILQTLFCHKKIEVIDAKTGRKEIATYKIILGIFFKISYQPQ